MLYSYRSYSQRVNPGNFFFRRWCSPTVPSSSGTTREENSCRVCLLGLSSGSRANTNEVASSLKWHHVYCIFSMRVLPYHCSYYYMFVKIAHWIFATLQVPSHVGTVPDQVPSSRHSLNWFPRRVKPLPHMNST